MSIYLDSYANAVEQLGETYLTPAYAAAKENYFKVFEMCAAAHVFSCVENDHIDEKTHITQEVVDDLKRQVEILRRVNYPSYHLKDWEWDLRFAQAQLIINPA